MAVGRPENSRRHRIDIDIHKLVRALRIEADSFELDYRTLRCREEYPSESKLWEASLCCSKNLGYAIPRAISLSCRRFKKIGPGQPSQFLFQNNDGTAQSNCTNVDSNDKARPQMNLE